MARVLIISYCVPPVMRGPSVLLARLLKYFPKDSYEILTAPFQDTGVKVDPTLQLPCPYHYVRAHSMFAWYEQFGRRAQVHEWLEVPRMVVDGLRVIRKRQIDRLLVVPNTGPFLLAAHWMHRLSGRPLFVYLFDMFASGMKMQFLRKQFARAIEPVTMRRARVVFVMSEPLEAHYEQKYGCRTVLLPHPVDGVEYEDLAADQTRSWSGNPKTPAKIVFTGMIYTAQVDAIQNLVRAVKGLSEIQVHLYTPVSRDGLEWWGGVLGENVIFHGSVAVKEVAAIQRSADILFLPMAFDAPFPDIIRTASPGKLPEYLTAQRPILVHAPSYSYIAWYARRHGFGLVVDRPDPVALREAIARLLNDGALRQELVTRARETAQAHDAARVSAMLQHHLGIGSGTRVADMNASIDSHLLRMPR